MQLQIYRDGRFGQSFVLHRFYRLNGYVYAEIPPYQVTRAPSTPLSCPQALYLTNLKHKKAQIANSKGTFMG